MSVIRVNKTENYTVMSNYHLKERNMSLKAKGLLSQMLSLPDTWDYSIAGLAAINKESVETVRSILTELKKFGYLVVTKKMPNETQTGRIEYVYDIFEEPQKQEGKKQGIEKQGLVLQGIEKQDIENHTQSNTNISNTKELNTNKSNNVVIDTIRLYNSICIDFPRAMENDTLSNLILRNQDYDYKTLFEIAQRSDFLTGRNGKWQANCEWLIRHRNKVMSGFYDDKKKPEKPKKDIPSYGDLSITGDVPIPDGWDPVNKCWRNNK